MDLRSSSSSGRQPSREFWLVLLLLAGVVSLLLGQSFLPGHTLFSNDGPLARLVSQSHRMPAAFTGVWEDLNSIGYREPGALPNISYGLRLLLGPVGFSKFYAPVALIILGMGAWCFFRQLELAPAACVIGALAAMLNSDFFSTAAWGVAAHPLTVGMTFFALAALVKISAATVWRGWLRVALAGFAVGMGLSEGADVGAIFSLYVAAFVIYQAWTEPGARVKNLVKGSTRLVVVVIFAAFMAAQAISVLVNTQIEGVSKMQQDEQTKDSHWEWATQWSLPKTETLSLIVPGLFGYRMDTQQGGHYWGRIGRDHAWDAYLANGQQGIKPDGFLRQTGGGIYVGISVVMVAIWAACQAFRRKNSIFDLAQKRWLRFWLGVALVSLLLGWGHFAPFYRLIYGLPYFSTIRNPIKFIAPFNVALLVIFAYGVDALSRYYLQKKKSGTPPPSLAVRSFDKKWIYGCIVVFCVSLVGWVIYANHQLDLQQYLAGVLFPDVEAQRVANFSVNQVGWFMLFLVLTALLMSVILSGGFRDGKNPWGVILLGTLVLFDLGRSDLFWVVDWNYNVKYASNPIVDFLRNKPYESRVTVEPFRTPSEEPLQNLYRYEWSQQQFQYYNIQSVDIVQMARVPEDLEAFMSATTFDGSEARAPFRLRRWELTNTRYLIGEADHLDSLNHMFDPQHNRFHTLERFNLVERGWGEYSEPMERITAEITPQGQYALFEFDGALPRAKLYADWVINTNNQATLDQLVNPAFDPAAKVITATMPAASPAGNEAVKDTGTVEISSYAPKNVVLKADAKAPAVLLLNDRYDPNWKAWVDGEPAPVLRCNYIMRGVSLSPGAHTVEFRFQPPVGALYVSLAAVGVGILMLGLVFVGQPRVVVKASVPVPAPVATPQPVPQSPAKAASQPARNRNRSRQKASR